MDRRTWLKLAASTAAMAAFPIPAFADDNPVNPKTFLETLEAEVERLAALKESDVKPFPRGVDDALAGLPYERYDDITYREDQAIWHNNAPFWIEPQHTAGSYYANPIELFQLDGPNVYPIPYSAQAFDFSKLDKPPAQPPKSGYAGFSALTQIDQLGVYKKFLSFLGGTNFSATGRGQAFGVSARGLAINIGQPEGEDYALFTKIWIERPKPVDTQLVVHALLESKLVAGRFKFTVKPGFDTVIDTEAVIRTRRRLNNIGIAPIASRFFFGPGVPPKRRDYRPRVHDSEALYIVNGAGEQIWRPLLNPERPQYSAFLDKAPPKGFGLIQKDRSFASYQDTAKQFERRPSLWIEPLEGEVWKEGFVELFELPAPEEINENILCFWRPKEGLLPYQRHTFSYRMHWCWDPPLDNKLAAVVQTRVGETKSGKALFIVDFDTRSCADCNTGQLLAEVTAGGETKQYPLELAPAASAPPETILPASGPLRRLRFEHAPQGSEPTDIRAQLTVNGKPVSDAWIFRWAR